MESVQLFLSIIKSGLTNEWNTTITETLTQLPAIEQVQVVEENENTDGIISIAYDVQQLSFIEIEKIIENSGASVASINIHFPSAITGITDPYGAGAASLKFEEKLKKIDGVLGGTISSSGKLKVEIDVLSNNKQRVIEEITKSIAADNH